MNVALLSPTFSPHSGIDRAVEQQSKKLLSLGNQVTIVTLDASMESPGVRIVNLGLPEKSLFSRVYRLFFFLDRKKINKAVEKLKDADHIHAHFYPMSILALKANKHFGTPITFYDYGIPPTSSFSSFVEKIYIILFRRLYFFFAKKFDHAVTISRFLAKEYKKRTGKEAVVKYIEIDNGRFHPHIDNMRIRRELAIPNDHPIVLYVGRISPHKGTHLLVQAYKIFKKEYHNAHLVLVGDCSFPKYLAKLRSLAGEDILFAGFVRDEELPHWYAACSVYATCSLWEGFDMPLVEAQACGKKAIAFDIGSHKEVIKDPALLVPEGDINLFAEKMKYAYAQAS